MNHESKALIVCMAEEMLFKDEASPVDGIVLVADIPPQSENPSYQDVLRYKGVRVSKYHNNAGVGYWGTYVN